MDRSNYCCCGGDSLPRAVSAAGTVAASSIGLLLKFTNVTAQIVEIVSIAASARSSMNSSYALTGTAPLTPTDRLNKEEPKDHRRRESRTENDIEVRVWRGLPLSVTVFQSLPGG